MNGRSRVVPQPVVAFGRMKRLRERAVIACPVEEAEPEIAAFFDGLRRPDGVTRMRLRVPMGRSAPFGFSLDREVRVEIERARDDENLNDLTRIAWQPEGHAALPRFDGTLTLWATDEPAQCWIELDGHYVPPLGVAGQIFDDAIGNQIAHATAREFLHDLKRWVESRETRAS